MESQADVTQSSHVSQNPIGRYLILLLLLAAGVRLMGIARPLVGPFATKNVVYAMIARNLAEGRSTLAYPTLDCWKGGQRSLHMLEFPVSAYLTAGLWRVCGGSLDVWGRGLSILFSIAAVAILFDFVRRRHGPIAGLAAATAFALAPVSMIYGQCFMLEASLACFTIGTFAALDRWLDGGRWGWLLLTWMSLSLALLTKIYMGVLLLPLTAAVFLGRTSDFRRRLWALVALALALVPAGLWYAHAWRAGDPNGPFAARIYYSVRDSAEAHWPPHKLARSPAFYKHLLDDLGSVVLTPLGLALLAAGFLHRAWRRYGWWLAASTILILLLPRKFFEMNYYWMAVLPVLCVLIGLGVQVLVQQGVLTRRATIGLLLIAVLLSLRYAAGPLWSIPPEDRAVVAAGRAMDRLARAEEPVVTMHGTTLDLLYYCRRPGWAIDPHAADLQDQLAACRRHGARYLVIAGLEPAPAAPPGVTGGELARGDGFAIFALPPPRGGAYDD